MTDDRTTQQGNLRCLARYMLAKDPRATIALHALEAADRIERLEAALGVFADALDEADNIIAVNCGTDTPKEWDRAYKRCAKARAALSASNEGGE